VTFRAILIGLIGAVIIATGGYYVGQVSRLNRFVCGQFPIIVYGPLVLAALLINPFLSVIRSRRRRLRPAELCVIIAATLAACSIPSNGLLRYFTRIVIMPLHLNEVQVGWKEKELLKDVPPAMLVNQGRFEPTAPQDEKLVRGFVAGLGKQNQAIGVEQVPWAQWSQTLAFWGVLILLFAAASVALALIVHPQWSKRERLRYPIAVFADSMLGSDESQPQPIYRQRWFWLALGLVFAYHLVNGLYVWWPDQLIRIPLRFDFSALTSKYKYLRHGWGAMTMGRPTIWPTAVALAFFLARDVTFSVGISQPLATVLGAFLLDMGLSRPEDFITGGTFQWQRAASCLALALMLLYLGRRYYSVVLSQALTFRRRGSEAEGYSVWACRVLLVSLAALVIVLCFWAELSFPLALAFVLLAMLAYLAVARITAEFGMFYVQIVWLPVAVLFGLFGGKALGPSGLITLGLLSTVFVTQPEESLMTFVLIGLKIGEGRRLSPGKAGGVAAIGFVLALAAALPFAVWVDYSYGGCISGWWDSSGISSLTFRALQQTKDELRLTGELAKSRTMDGTDRLLSARPNSAFLWSAGLGFAAVLVTYVLRLRYTWWPIHPIMFLVWETWASAVFFHSFLLAWVLQVLITRFGTHEVHRAAKHAMVGIIAGELLGGMLWMCVGGAHFAATGVRPPYYNIFPY